MVEKDEKRGWKEYVFIFEIHGVTCCDTIVIQHILILPTEGFAFTLFCYVPNNTVRYTMWVVFFMFFNILIAVEACSDRKASENIFIRAPFVL